MPTFYKRKSGMTRQQWDLDNMKEAIEKVRNEGMSVRGAAEKFDVPRSTLSRYVKSEKPDFSTVMGPSGCLGEENEKKLAMHLKDMSKAGFPLNSLKIRQLAFDFAERLEIPHKFNKKNSCAGYDWFRSFMRRNSDLSVRKSEGLSAARAKGLSRKRVQEFYDLLDVEIKKHGLHNKPQNISNCDESGIQLINSTGKVVASKGSKAVYQVTTGERGETVTLIACCTAEGRFLPPCNILKGKKLKREFEDGLPPSSKVFMNQQSAYVNTSLFLRWFEEIDVPRKAEGYNILILDGHCSHSLSIKLLESAKENKVSLLCLPSHTTHVLQPLDKTFFGPFKAFFKTATSTWVNQNIGRNVTRYQLGPLVKTAWDKAATVGNATSGFKSTGIFPFNRNVIPDHFFAISDRMQDADKKNLSENEILSQELSSRPQMITKKTSKLRQLSTGTKENNGRAQSPTTILRQIEPVPVLQAAKKTGRQAVGATLLTSKNYHDKLNSNLEKKKKTPIKKTNLVKKKRTEESENNLVNKSSSDEEELPRAPKRKQASRKAERMDSSLTCRECKTNKNSNLLRCNKCKAWFHVTCSIFDDACIDCGRKVFQER